jgi:hypothetical protein
MTSEKRDRIKTSYLLHDDDATQKPVDRDTARRAKVLRSQWLMCEAKMDEIEGNCDDTEVSTGLL